MQTPQKHLSSYLQAKEMAASGVLQVRWHGRLDTSPLPLPNTVRLSDKVEGMLLGLAIGDALGNTSESINPSDRLRRHGWIENYLPNRHAAGRPIGLPSDDTQLAAWAMEQLIEDGRLEPQSLGQRFAAGRIFGIGKAMREFLSNFKGGAAWQDSGARSAGNGALMRIAPVLLPHLHQPSPDLWADTLLAAHLTHNDELSNISCLALVQVLWSAIGMSTAPQPTWWFETFLQVMEDVQIGTRYPARGDHPPGFNGTLPDLLHGYVLPALQQDLPVDQVCGIWHSGAYLLETVPAVLYILSRYGHDPQQAILQAVNNTRDNDTVAAIVGAVMGALHGASSFRPEWISGLSGRTREHDDGHFFKLLASAGQKFGFAVGERG